MKIRVKDIYSYYDLPIIFSASDEEGNTFICMFVDENGIYLRYLCVKVSSTVLLELENNQKDLRDIFEHSEKVFDLLLNAQSEEPVEIFETLEDITRFLPNKGLFIGKSRKTETVPQVGQHSRKAI
jgi:hypothetical protein